MKASLKQLCEMNVQEDIGIGAWNKLKAELDVIYGKRKKRRGPPTADDRLEIEIDKYIAYNLNVRLYHSHTMGMWRCICPRCAERRTESAAFTAWRQRQFVALRAVRDEAQCFIFDEPLAQ